MRLCHIGWAWSIHVRRWVKWFADPSCSQARTLHKSKRERLECQVCLEWLISVAET